MKIYTVWLAESPDTLVNVGARDLVQAIHLAAPVWKSARDGETREVIVHEAFERVPLAPPPKHSYFVNIDHDGRAQNVTRYGARA